MLAYPYAYIVWCGMFAVVWIFLCWVRRDTRREMLLTSLVIAPSGPIVEYFHSADYWKPQFLIGSKVGIEDPFIGFFFAGIAAVFYEWTPKSRPQNRRLVHGWWYVAAVYVFALAVLLVGAYLDCSSMHTALALMFGLGVVATLLRPRILKHALYSSGLFGLFLFLFYLFFFWLHPGITDAWWTGASGVRLLGVPVEEVAWGFLWGFVIAPVYELVVRLPLPRYIR